MNRAHMLIVLAFLLGFPGRARTDEFPVEPYTDPGQLNVQWPKHSHYKQPWRGFLETRSGYDFLRGIGINYHVPGNDAVAVRSPCPLRLRGVRCSTLAIALRSLCTPVLVSRAGGVWIRSTLGQRATTVAGPLF